MKLFNGIIVLLILAFCLPLSPQITKNYMEYGGDKWYIGGTLEVKSAGILNIASGGYFKIAGTTVSATAADLNKLNGVTLGTVLASKFVAVDANKDIASFRNVTVQNLDAGASAVVGTVDVFPTTATRGKLQIAANDSAGDTTTQVINASQAGVRTYTIPDAGASADFVMTAGAQTIGGAKTFSSALLNSFGIVAAPTAVTSAEYGDGAVHKTVLTVTFSGANLFTLADGAHGAGKKIYDFPEGYIQVLGVTLTGTLTNTAGFNAHAADTFSFGVGTVTAADDDALTATEQDIIASATVDTTSGTVLTRTQTGSLAVVTAWDGTGGAKDAYLNLAIADANNTASNDFTFVGTVTITWVNLGDY